MGISKKWGKRWWVVLIWIGFGLVLFRSSDVNREKVRVAEVIDGDTIKLENGQVVRYIGIDAPETVHPDKPIQCYGKEAFNKNKELVEGKEIEMEKGVPESDEYARLLRYIWVEDIFVNEYLVREGFARSSTYLSGIEYKEKFEEAEREAREEGRGLWGSDCDNW
jgi:micrococcal nuclease